MSGTGNRLAELREAREWHRSKVGAQFNVGDRTVYRWETGETPIPSELIPDLAALFEVSAEHLMGWDREPAETGKAAA
jgi:transcriptional regulator with XRE-family HTH domain